MTHQEMKTYSIRAPLATHYRPATCEEYGCSAQENGWMSPIDETTDLGAEQAHYIRTESGRKYREQRREDGRTLFVFEAGQTCFTRHHVPLDRPELFLVRDRGQVMQHQAEDWVDDFLTHQQKIADAIQEG